MIEQGQKFNKLTAIQFHELKGRHPYWLFKCDCGHDKIACIYNVIKGKTKSCGCMVRGITTHGMSKTRFYDIRVGIIKRCYNKKASNYYLYGARGIKVSDERLKFENFMEDMYGSYLEHCSIYGIKDTTIDRIHVNDNYYKDNCKRSTLQEQARSKRTNLLYEYNGIIRSLKERADEFKLPYKRVYYRIFRFKWDFKKAITTGIKTKYRNKKK